jgi:hypothetical protein
VFAERQKQERGVRRNNRELGEQERREPTIKDVREESKVETTIDKKGLSQIQTIENERTIIKET